CASVAVPADAHVYHQPPCPSRRPPSVSPLPPLSSSPPPALLVALPSSLAVSYPPPCAGTPGRRVLSTRLVLPDVPGSPLPYITRLPSPNSANPG
ncbi:hypothetical protein EIP91_008760, partial [Steccherinum ochraceum]